MEAIYRIYDTIEKTHRDDMFIWPDGNVFRKYKNEYWREEIDYIDQSDVWVRYIVEPLTRIHSDKDIDLIGRTLLSDK